MTDQWVPGPPPVPTPPIAGLPPANSWTPSPPCTSGDNPSFVDGVVITGVPATIVAPYAWGITLNDGSAPPNFSIDHYDGAGNLIDHPLDFSGVDGSAQFATPVFLSRDPVEDMEAATKGWVEANSAGVTEAPEDGQVYGRSNAAWTPLPNLPDAPNDGQAYVRQSLDWAPLSAQLTGYLPLTGGTVTGNLTVNQIFTVQGSNSVVLNGGVGASRSILGTLANVMRWQLTLGDVTSEGLGNAGSNFSLTAYSNTGAFLSTALAINRATGAATFGGTLTVPGQIGVVPALIVNKAPGNTANIAGQTNGALRWQLSLADYTGELGSNFGSNFRLDRYDDSGAIIPGASPLLINRASGQATFSAIPSFPGGVLNYVLATNGAGVLAWAYSLPEAPLDGQQYARRDATWTPFVSGPPTTISDTAPPSPQAGQLWWDSVGGQLYVWYQDANSAQWIVAVNVASALPPASTTTLGGVKVDGTSIKAATDGTISTVLIPMNDNRIINGDMRIDQRNGGAAGTAYGYTVDRWVCGGTVAGQITWQQTSNSGCPGFLYALRAISNSAHTVVAGDTHYIVQSIEADMVSDFQWGSASAQPVTLSFWVYCSLTGTFSGSVSNVTGTRSYAFTYSIPTANAWTKIAIPIPGDTAGTWNLSGNGGALNIAFDLGSGATYRGPANAWASANYVGANGAVNLVASNGAGYLVTGVKLEIGSVATPFNRQSLAKSLADCQRYYQAIIGLQLPAYAGGAGGVTTPMVMWPPMRALPTATPSDQTYGNGSGLAIGAVSPSVANTFMVAAAAGSVYCNFNLTLDAEL